MVDSQTKHTVLLEVVQMGMDAVTGTMKNLNSTTGIATKQQAALSSSIN